MNAAVLKSRLDWQPMQLDDLDAVLAVENVIYPFPWTAGNFRDSLASGYYCWIVAERGVMVGYAVVMTIVDEVHLLNLSVAAERQRQGIGGEMLESLCAMAAQRGLMRMLLEVRPSNTSALALYVGHGFTEIGRRRAYYPAADGREDAIVMGRML